MIIQKKTLDVLKNFYSINPSIVVKEGSSLTTISTGKTIVAKAKIPDTFVKRFALYNLGQFINTVTSFENPELSFSETHVVIKESSKTDSTKITYADESGIKVPPEKAINLPSIDATCRITAEFLQNVQKQRGILDLPEIAIVGDGENVYLQALDSKNATSNTFSIIIGSTDKNFRAIFKSENIKIIPGDYDVDICSKGISHFKGVDIEYWIAVESNSTYS